MCYKIIIIILIVLLVVFHFKREKYEVVIVPGIYNRRLSIPSNVPEPDINENKFYARYRYK